MAPAQPFTRLGRAVAVLLLVAAATPVAPSAEVLEWLPVDHPAYRELDLLVTEGLIDTTFGLDARPVARIDAAKLVAQARARHPDRLTHPGLVRLSREFSREFVELGLEPETRYTPPLVDVPKRRTGESADSVYAQGRLRLIPYLAMAYERSFEGVGQFVDGSRLGLRIGVELGSLLLYSDLWAGKFKDAEEFTDALIKGSDLILYTEDTYVSWRSRWLDFSFGRNRTALGPGRSGSLLWSSTAEPTTNIRWGGSLLGGKLRGTILHADVDASEWARLAAHRLDWVPIPSLSFGLQEAARYTSSHWEPLYVIGILPYALVQRLLETDTRGDSAGVSVRNNVMLGLDARWRLLPGTSLYGEFLIDDINLEEGGAPSRLAYQFGWLGAGRLFGKRLAWRGEFTRINRFVYTVFYGENFIHQAEPLGYPTGSDSRTLRADFQYDFSSDWYLDLSGIQVEKGEGGIDEFYDPDGPPASGSGFGGVVETTRLFRTGLTWTPRDGVELRGDWSYRWRDNANHTQGLDDEDWGGRLAVLLRH
jgi:hypothetical protein